MIINKMDSALTVYDREGLDFKVAVVRYNSKQCNIYYLVDGSYEFLGGLSRKDGSDLTEEEILSHVALLFE